MQLQTLCLGSEPVLALGDNQAGGLTLLLVSLVDRTKRQSRSRMVLNSLRGQSLGAKAKHKAIAYKCEEHGLWKQKVQIAPSCTRCVLRCFNALGEQFSPKAICPPGNIGQCLEMCQVITPGDEDIVGI